jgi:drug/metabolite transporter (DMT)-like permease
MIWSTTPLAIKWSGEGVSGFLFGASGRMALGAVLSLLLTLLLRVEFPWHRKAFLTYLAASTTLYGGMMATYWGAQYIPSGLIAVLFGITPIITSIITIIWLGERSPSLNKWTGMFLGVIGLGIIFSTELRMGSDGIKGLLAILVAVFIHSFSAVWIKHLNVSVSPLAMTTGGLLIAVLLYGLTWLGLGEALPTTLSSRVVLSVIYLGIFGSVVGFILYYYLLKHLEPRQTALLTLLTPINSLFLGQYLNGEVIDTKVWIGTAIVIGGLAIYQWGKVPTKSV